MEIYDYEAHVAEDLRNNLPEWFKRNDINKYTSLEGLIVDIEDYYRGEGGIACGAASACASDTWAAEENLCHNMDLFFEAVGDYDLDYSEYIENGAVACDALVRWYVLGRVASDVIEEYVTKNYPDFGR